MANPYYNPSGSPGTGAAGASAPMRAEFASVGDGFNMLPNPIVANKAVVANAGGTGFTMTAGSFALAGDVTFSGTFSTIFVAQSNATYTLPAASDTLMGRASVDTITNKTFDTAGTGNVLKINGVQLTDLSQLNGPTTGDLKPTHKLTADSGWIMWSDGTIGSAASGASIRANADCSALYALYWSYSDAVCPVTGGRGASAAADFAANKPIAIPVGAGRVMGLAGSGAGLTVRNAGTTLGEETHALTAAENGPHSHSYSDPGHGHGVSDPTHTHFAQNQTYQGGNFNGGSTPINTQANNINGAATGISIVSNGIGITISSSGSGTGHNNMQPTFFCNIMIKL